MTEHTAPHDVEVFIDETLTDERTYGWACTTCRTEVGGLATLAEAKRQRDHHNAGVR